MKVKDHTLPECDCAECQQAGITDRPQVRDPFSGKVMHGYELRRYWQMSDEAMEQIRKKIAGSDT